MSTLFFDWIFVLSVPLIWVMLIYHFVLCLLGYAYSLRAAREKRDLALTLLDRPPISLLIPAQNEAVVPDSTLRARAALNYPADKLEVIVINDASSDGTGAIADAWAARN